MNEKPFSLVVLISGGGTTLRNLVDVHAAGQLDASISLVISSNPEAGGIAIAESAGIPCRVFDYRDFRDARTMSDCVFDACRDAQIDLVVMGGFLRRVIIPNEFKNRVINIHPSLIPAHCGAGMYGIRVHRAVLEQGSRLTGCTVHFVDNHFDHGPIIAQESVPVLDNDTPELLASRVFETECHVYPRVINAIARNQIRVVGDEVVFGLP